MGFMALGMSLHWACPFFNVTRIFCLQPPSTGWLQQDGLRIVHLNLFLDPVETKHAPNSESWMIIIITVWRWLLLSLYIYKYICTALREKKTWFPVDLTLNQCFELWGKLVPAWFLGKGAFWIRDFTMPDAVFSGLVVPSGKHSNGQFPIYRSCSH